MKVLVDTSIWSLALRRKSGPDTLPVRKALTALIDDGRVVMAGPIRQELLSGIKEPVHFVRLRDHLRAFPDLELSIEDYEEAASFFNACRAKGIQGSNTDFLLCAIASRRSFPVFSSDLDFDHFAKILPIELFKSRDLHW